MTKEQYERYQDIEKEIKPIRRFLFWCGERYHDKTVGKYQFSLKTAVNRFLMRTNRHWVSESENEFQLPEELQRRVVKVMEDYLEEKEKEQAAL